MTCQPMLLDALLAGELSPARAEEVRAHAADCERCGERLAELSATVGLLRRAGVVEPPDGFAQALHRRLAQAGRPAPVGLMARLRERLALRPLAVGVASGVAAAALVLAVAPRLRRPAPVEAAVGPVQPTFRVPARKLAVVKIDFVAEQPVEDVAFAVSLPDGLHFVSGGRELPDREFRWRGALEKGENDIPVAVRGAKAGRYRIEARAVGDGVAAAHQVVLEVTEG